MEIYNIGKHYDKTSTYGNKNMRAQIAIVTPTNTRMFLYYMAQFQGAAQLTSDVATYATLGPTSSLVFVPLYTANFTVDTEGVISVANMLLFISTNNDANAVCKLQISGDGGNTFVDATGEIGTGALSTSGPGLWLSNVQAGLNKFQIRIMGKSTNANPANILVEIDSFIECIFNKSFL